MPKSKDPAFLFYPSDWLSGTMTFPRQVKGAYMDLLVGQFNNGHMSLHMILQILGQNDFEAMWETYVKAKFVQDENGLYYNKRLEEEVLKRKNYVESRKKNRGGVGHHMSIHMENENDNSNSPVIDQGGVVGIEYELSQRLFDAILTRNPGHKKPDLDKWARHIDLMIRVDKRDPDEIARVIDWCQADSFWQNNILSTEKLRIQYDQLLLKMNQTQVLKTNSTFACNKIDFSEGMPK